MRGEKGNQTFHGRQKNFKKNGVDDNVTRKVLKVKTVHIGQSVWCDSRIKNATTTVTKNSLEVCGWISN